MDIATIGGITLCVILIVASVLLGGSPIIFINIPSVLIVVGGTIGATLIRNPLAEVIGTAKIAMKAFTIKLTEPVELIGRIVEFSRKARKEGMLALESVDCGYAFLQKAITLAVDGLEQEEIKSILTNDLQGMASRHKRGREILEGMGAAAPAFGMIGTLIGLVQMLASMDDPSSIGPSMAVALLTTL
jgi:chemotaxis protein MotA